LQNYFYIFVFIKW